MHVFICIRMKFQEADGSAYTVPRIIPITDITRVEPHPNDPSLTYANIRNLPENTEDDDVMLEHSFEEIAKIMGCEINHMKNNFSLASAPADNTTAVSVDTPEP